MGCVGVCDDIPRFSVSVARRVFPKCASGEAISFREILRLVGLFLFLVFLENVVLFIDDGGN